MDARRWACTYTLHQGAGLAAQHRWCPHAAVHCPGGAPLPPVLLARRWVEVPLPASTRTRATCNGGPNARAVYEVLGVQEDASAQDIKSAWRERAKELHPDQNREVGIMHHNWHDA